MVRTAADLEQSAPVVRCGPSRGPRERPLPARRSLLLGAAALAPLVALGAGRADALDGFRDAGGLRMIDGSPWVRPEIRSVDFRVDTGGTVRTFHPSIRVTVPPGYSGEAQRRYPVLLLLHGRGGSHLDWTEQGNVIEQTMLHEVIVVSPDGGAGSFYSDAHYPLPDRDADWESFVIGQVLPFVHANFRTDPHRMAIAGLSMGGWGALSLGQRHRELFRSVSSYSGPADCTPHTLDGAGVAGTIWIGPAFDAEKHWETANPPGATWGPLLHPPIARSYNPIDNLEAYRGRRLFLRTGDGPWADMVTGLDENPDLWTALETKLGEAGAHAIENAVHPNLERFAAALRAAGIAHDYELIPGGTHEWGLWRDNLAEDLPGMMAVLRSADPR